MDIENFQLLLPTDQQAIEIILGKTAATESVDDEFKQQNEMIEDFKKEIMCLKMEDVLHILKKNHQHIPAGESAKIDMVVDILSFGALDKCEKCKDFEQGECATFVLGNLGYVCTGNFSSWAKCDNVLTEPKRFPVRIPSKLQEMSAFFRNYSAIVRIRKFRSNTVTKITSRLDEICCDSVDVSILYFFHN